MADDDGHDPDPTVEDGPTAGESVVREYWERVWLGRDLDALEDLVADQVVRHTAEGTETLTRLGCAAALPAPSRPSGPAR